jgi:hypothetical protein
LIEQYYGTALLWAIIGTTLIKKKSSKASDKPLKNTPKRQFKPKNF